VANGNGQWVKWTAGILASVFISVLTILGNNVIANENKRVTDSKEIRSEMKASDEKILDKVEHKVEKIDEKIVRLDDKIETYQMEQRSVNMAILDKLDAIKRAQ